MLLLGEGSEATEPCNKYDKIRLHSIRSLQFDQVVRPLSFRPEKFDLFTATRDSTVLYISNFLPTYQILPTRDSTVLYISIFLPTYQIF